MAFAWVTSLMRLLARLGTIGESKPTLIISNQDFFRTLSLEPRLFYSALLTAVASLASEVRYQVSEDGRYATWFRIEGVDYPAAPQRKETALHILAWARLYRSKTGDGCGAFRLKISAQKVEVEILETANCLTLRFLNQAVAQADAERILTEVLEEGYRARQIPNTNIKQGSLAVAPEAFVDMETERQVMKFVADQTRYPLRMLSPHTSLCRD